MAGKTRAAALLAGVTVLCSASPAGAQEVNAADVQANLDNVFVLVSAILVMFMFFDRLKVDDPVGAISVHGVWGAFGTIGVGPFATADTDFWQAGPFYGGGTSCPSTAPPATPRSLLRGRFPRVPVSAKVKV